jgi:ketosteroid isomerase-like protein
MMLPAEQAAALAQRWIAAWNAHDLDAILALYRDDFSMSSPYISKVVGEASGRLHGKAAVGAYWQRALERFPDLHFELQHVLTGVDSLTLIYHSNRSGLAVELFDIDEHGVIAAARAHYVAEA